MGTPHSDEAWRKFAEAVTGRIVDSKFSEVAVPGTGLSPRIYRGMVYMEIDGPVVLELVHLTEVGVSAFELDKIREEHDKASQASLMSLAERGLLPTSRNRANIQATLPPYPRKCLKLILSDGTTELPALECEPLPLELGETQIGLKVSCLVNSAAPWHVHSYLMPRQCLLLPLQMRLENIPIRAGVAYLRRENVHILGGVVESSEEGYFGRLYSEFRMRMQQEVALTRVSRRLLHVPDLGSANSGCSCI